MITLSGSLHTTNDGIGTKRKWEGLVGGIRWGGRVYPALSSQLSKDAPCTQLLFSSHFLEIMVMADRAVPACQPTVDGDSGGKKQEGTK